MSSSTSSSPSSCASSSFPPDVVSPVHQGNNPCVQPEREDGTGCQSPNGLSAQTSHENLFETIAKLVGIERPMDGEEEENEKEEQIEEEKAQEQLEEEEEKEETEQGNKSDETTKSPFGANLNGPSHCSGGSSSSRRKNGNPTRISEGEIGGGGEVKDEPKEEGQEEEEELEDLVNGGVGAEEDLPSGEPNPVQVPEGQSAAGPFAPHPFGLFRPQEPTEEQQRRLLYSSLVQQGQGGQAHLQQGQMLEIQRNFTRLAQNLKEELSGLFAGAIDKADQVLGDFSISESQAHAGRLLAALSLAARQHQWAAEQLGLFSQGQASRAQMPPLFSTGRPPLPPPPPSSTPNSFHAFLAQNPLMAAMAAASAAQQFPAGMFPLPASSGIFPMAAPPNGFMPLRPFGPVPSATHQSHRQHLTEADGTPRKKRAKVTDSVRGPRSSLHTCREPSNSSTSERSTPHGFAPPTMVPLSSQLLFRPSERTQGGSPSGGDDSERNSANGDVQVQGTQLTHVHLRKAKLMFFYQRYPSSTLLKSFFPDVKFNKHNTAQLVKWFSNFREFYYMQMEKYAKQALAEGVRHREELVVTQETEIFKQLNVHYNKNSIFQPPERLQFVVQETLREFFLALQQQKDAEPSWKKAIYKVIQQLDEPIPEFFKHPEFVEMLERTT